MKSRGNQRGKEAAPREEGATSARSGAIENTSATEENRPARNETNKNVNKNLTTKNTASQKTASKNKPAKTKNSKNKNVLAKNSSDKTVLAKISGNTLEKDVTSKNTGDVTDVDKGPSKKIPSAPAKIKSNKEQSDEVAPADAAKGKSQRVPRRTAPSRGRGGRGKRRRKPRISPEEEHRRREFKKWLSDRAYILGIRIAPIPPEPPFFIKRERELIAEREAQKREQALAAAAKSSLEAQRRAHAMHDAGVLARYSKQRALQQKKADETEQRLERRLADLEEQRAQRVRAQQRKVYEQRMREVKLAELRRHELKLMRQDEARVVRILKNKI